MIKTSRILFLSLLIIGSTLASKSIADQNNIEPSDTAIIRQELYQYLDAIGENYEESRVVFTSLVTHLFNLTKEFYDFKIHNLSELIEYEAKTGNMSFADSVSRIILKEVKDNKDSVNFPYAFHSRGIIMRRNGMMDSAKHYFELANAYAKKYDNIKYNLRSQLMLGVAYAMLGDYNNAEKIFREGIDLSKFVENRQSEADLNMCLAIVHKKTGNISSALQLYKSTIETLEALGSTKNYPEVLNNLASIYMDLGVDSLAMHYFEKSVKVSRELNSLLILGIGLVNLANFEMNYENYDKAWEYIKEFTGLMEKHDISRLRPVASKITGKYHVLTGNDKLAKPSLINALKEAKKQNDAIEIMTSANMLGALYLRENKTDSASWYASYAFDLAEKNNTLREMAEAARTLANIEVNKSNYHTAVKYYQVLDSVSQAFQDSLNVSNNRNFGYRYEMQRKENQNRLLQKEASIKQAALESKTKQIKYQKTILYLSLLILVVLVAATIILVFQYNMKNRLNKLLISKNEEVLEANKRLKEENDFKNKLFSIVSHDVRSPVVSLHQLLMLLSSGVIDEEKRNKIVTDLTVKTSHTVELIDNLLMWTRQQMVGNKPELKSFEVGELVKKIVLHNQYNAKKKGIAIINNIPGGVNVFSDSNTLSLVFRNLISNAIKFTDEEGEITLDYIEEKDGITFSVRDTGQGIKEEYKDKILDENNLFTTKGTIGEKGNGMGLYLCKKFIKQCQGNIWFRSEEGKGTCFYFSVLKSEAQVGQKIEVSVEKES